MPCLRFKGTLLFTFSVRQTDMRCLPIWISFQQKCFYHMVFNFLFFIAWLKDVGTLFYINLQNEIKYYFCIYFHIFYIISYFKNYLIFKTIPSLHVSKLGKFSIFLPEKFFYLFIYLSQVRKIITVF